MKEPKIGSKSMEDFSFPIISNPFSNLMIPSSSSSSSLWRVSSRVFHHDVEEEDDDGRAMEVRSMFEEGLSPMMMSRRDINVECMSCQEWEMDVEERMDYLWEDFNHEEEKRDNKRVLKQGSMLMGRRTCSSDNIRCRSRSRSRSRSKNSSILVMGKLLKGLLSIKKSAQHKIMKARF